MKVALYVGTHKDSSIYSRIGWWLTKTGQKGPLAGITHCEAILEEFEDGSVEIASSSLRDGGVRIKRTTLNPSDWVIVDVPSWSAVRARYWFTLHAGQKYDWRGAAATLLPGHHVDGRWFCSESILASQGWHTPFNFAPAQFAAICYSLA